MYNLRIKGGVVGMDQCETLVITSNVSPGMWYPDIDDKTWDGVRRRIEKNCYYYGGGEPVCDIGPAPRICREILNDFSFSV